MTYATLREALYDFFTHNAPLVSDGDYYSSEDVFTALPYAKGRRYFDAVALFALNPMLRSPKKFLSLHVMNKKDRPYALPDWNTEF